MDTEDSEKLLKAQENKWTAANMFSAIYFSKLETGTYTGAACERTSMENNARSAFMHGLETATDGVDPANVRRMTCHISAVANWILIAGWRLFTACRENADSEEEWTPLPIWLGGQDGGEWLWSGSWRFSIER